MQFDTRNKKPKLWNIATVSCVTAAVIGFLVYQGPDRYAAVISGISDLYYLIVMVLLFLAFIKQLQYNPYSYNTIYYMGFLIFVLSVFITNVFLTVRIVRDPDVWNSRQIIYTLLRSASFYMQISFPFILIFSTALCISNISLIRHEGRRFVNLLGIILSVLLIAGESFLFLYDNYAGSMRQVFIHDLFAYTFAAVYLYFECMLIGTIIANIIVVNYEPEADKDFIIILGCGMRKDGTPTPLLRGRIDRAVAFYEKQKALTGKELKFIPSGGQGPREVTTECASMKQYLLERGIPEHLIIEEDKAANTYENMKFSKAKIEECGGKGAKIAFSTTNYHVFRSGLLARRVKMRAQGIGAKTKWYFWPNAAVREFTGLLTEHRGKQALIFGSLIAAYIVLTVLNYR